MYEAMSSATSSSSYSSYTLNDLVRLWLHEALRLFQDRLTETHERGWTEQMIDDVALKHFPSIDFDTGTCMDKCERVCVCVCIRVYLYIYIYTYTLYKMLCTSLRLDCAWQAVIESFHSSISVRTYIHTASYAHMHTVSVRIPIHIHLHLQLHKHMYIYTHTRACTALSSGQTRPLQ